MLKARHYSKAKHISNLINEDYYKNLVIFRSVVELACDTYFRKLAAPKVDLFMVARGISSPMGKGSDSLPIPFMLGKDHVFLVDSSQFGMEPLVQKNFEAVYCYLPSFRGEDSDNRHLNQFYHCEAEIRGDYKQNMKVAEDLIRFLIKTIVKAKSAGVFLFESDNIDYLASMSKKAFPIISFDEAEQLLNGSQSDQYIEHRDYGRVLTSAGELKLCDLVADNRSPLWVTHYDRDTVPFYQKPDPQNPDRVLNGDLIFPSIKGSFGGEIVGSGQRQDSADEIIVSMDRQGVHNKENYQWYIDLRKDPKYKTTAGFGVGIERFLAWCLGLPSIVDVCIYPVIKDEGLYY